MATLIETSMKQIKASSQAQCLHILREYNIKLTNSEGLPNKDSLTEDLVLRLKLTQSLYRTH